MRILFVCNLGRRAWHRQFYSTDNKLINGFIRLGHFVLPFSDRDEARDATPLHTRKLGARRMNRKMIGVARLLKPDLVLFGHADMAGATEFAALRDAVPGVQLAQFNVDSPEVPHVMRSMADRARHLDLSFVTNADRDLLSRYVADGCDIRFFPNVCDASVETALVCDRPVAELAYDGSFLGSGSGNREDQVLHLRAHLPADYRLLLGGNILGTQRYWGHEFLHKVAMAAVSLGLPLDDSGPVPALYASDRLAQLLSSGVLPMVPATARLTELYDEAVVPYDSRESLIEAMVRLRDDDAERRRRGALAWRLARERFDGARIAKYMVECMSGSGFSEDYGWPGDPLLG